MSLISLHQVSRSYSRAAMRVHALDQVCLDIAAGDSLAVTGVAGSGKSTLLNLLSLLDCPSSGELYWQGAPLKHSSNKQRHHLRLQHIGYIPQQCQLVETYTVAQNIDLGLAASSATPSERADRVAAALAQLDLLALADCLPSQLAMGQQHCVAIARAVIAEPLLLLADAPTAQLDSHQAQQVMRLFHTLQRAGSAIVLASHDLSAIARCARTVELRDGRIVADTRHAA